MGLIAGMVALCDVTIAQQFLAAPHAVRIVADGKPWFAVPDAGPQARLTLSPDGTGVFDGPMKIATTWQIKGEEICLNLQGIGVKCLRFVQTQTGFNGFEGRKLSITLSR